MFKHHDRNLSNCQKHATNVKQGSARNMPVLHAYFVLAENF